MKQEDNFGLPSEDILVEKYSDLREKVGMYRAIPELFNVVALPLLQAQCAIIEQMKQEIAELKEKLKPPFHKCKYCGVMTDRPDEDCYKAPKKK